VFQSKFFSLAVLLLAGFTLQAADLSWSVYDKKTEKKLLDLDGKAVENADGKKILVCDGKQIENADGTSLLAFDKDTTSGFSVRNPKDAAVRLLWCSGHELCKKVEGGVVFHYDGLNQNLASDSKSPAIYTLTCHNGNGDSRLQPWQVVAIAYALQPKLFEVSAADMKAQRDAASATEKEEDLRVANRLKGQFDIITSSVKTLNKGSANVKAYGKYFHVTYDFTDAKKLQGIGLFLPSAAQDNEEILVALSDDGIVGLGLYEIKEGALEGTWHPTSLIAEPKTALGVEKLTGKTGDDLTGQFKITEAKTPGKGDAYTGTLDLEKIKRFDGNDVPTYQMTWTFGELKMIGAGMVVEHFGADSKRKKYLVAAAGKGEVVVGQHWRPSSSVQLNFAASGKTIAGGEKSGFVMIAK
jgi:hypothetical protein